MVPTGFKSTQQNQLNGKMPGDYPHEYKYISATVSLRDEDDNHFCLGTAFKPQRILTTANCVFSKSNVVDFGGMYVLARANFHPEAGIKCHVQKISINRHYESRIEDISLENNLAIITVSYK